MGNDYNENDWNPDNLVIGNNPYEIDLSTGYDNMIPTSTVLMSADDWDNKFGN